MLAIAYAPFEPGCSEAKYSSIRSACQERSGSVKRIDLDHIVELEDNGKRLTHKFLLLAGLALRVGAASCGLCGRAHPPPHRCGLPPGEWFDQGVIAFDPFTAAHSNLEPRAAPLIALLCAAE